VPGAGQHVDRQAEGLAVERRRSRRAVGVIVGTHDARVALELREGHREERREVLVLGGRRDEEHALRLGPAALDVVEPQHAGERMADDDALAAEGLELASERVEPLRQERRVGVRQVRIGDVLAVAAQAAREPGLPVPRPGALPAVEDEERPIHAATVPVVSGADLDVRALRCPMTWVRTKLALERLASGDVLTVRCAPGEALDNVPRSARAAGHAATVDGTTVRIVRA